MEVIGLLPYLKIYQQKLFLFLSSARSNFEDMKYLLGQQGTVR